MWQILKISLTNLGRKGGVNFISFTENKITKNTYLPHNSEATIQGEGI